MASVDEVKRSLRLVATQAPAQHAVPFRIRAEPFDEPFDRIGVLGQPEASSNRIRSLQDALAG